MCNFYIPCDAIFASVQMQNSHMTGCKDKVSHILKLPFMHTVCIQLQVIFAHLEMYNMHLTIRNGQMHVCVKMNV